MRIAYFTDTLAPEINGVTNTLSYLTGYLQRMGIEFQVFAPDYSDTAVEDQDPRVLRFKGFRPYVNPSSRLAFPAHGQVLSALEAFRPDLVHIVSELGIGYAGLRAARQLKLPLVMSYHTNFDQYLRYYDFPQLEKLYWKYMAWFHSFPARNLCPSTDTMRQLEARGFPQLELWSRGVDLSIFSPSRRSEELRRSLGGGEDRVLFLYAGRLSREKGLDTLAKAIRVFHGWYGDRAGFVFAGDGPYMEHMNGLELPNAVFTGFQSKERLAELYASCDALVFPSGTETFGNVVLEAMASALPVLCVDAGGITDFTSHLDNAYVCGNGHIMGMAKGMSLLLSSPALRDSLARGGLETARRRSWDGVFHSLMEQYAAVCAETAPALLAGGRKSA
ncbi:GDP-mannose-dependent alpha-mannosyltransferase [bioreactor metagenome]|uniref:GDP-mannose-dependent alpha-mannosyltransferase n=1 Tax=bioreactor metagenome TaxID=1076179 RepID=A0A644XYR9_9ZZZZ